MSTDAQNVRRCWSETLWPSGCAQTWMKNGDLTLENSRGFSTWICKACCLADCCRVTTAGVETEPDGGAAAGVITFCGHCGSCSWHGIDGWWSARRFKLHWDVLQRNGESLMMRRCWWPDERCTLASPEHHQTQHESNMLLIKDIQLAKYHDLHGQTFS